MSCTAFFPDTKREWFTFLCACLVGILFVVYSEIRPSRMVQGSRADVEFHSFRVPVDNTNVSKLALMEESKTSPTSTPATMSSPTAFPLAQTAVQLASEANFARMYNESFDVCSTKPVLIRADNFGIDEDPTVRRPWTVQPDSFRILPERCTSTQSVIDSVTLGQRVWNSTNSSITDLDMENMPSVFIPHKCYIPFYTSQEICGILDKYSSIVLSGDSLTRHMVQAMWMLLKSNLTCAEMPDASMCILCACDGTFSENVRCRYGPPNPVIPREMCPNTTFDMYHVERESLSQLKTDSRPQMYFLQGGIHFGSNSASTWTYFVEPWIHRIPTSAKVIYTGLHAHSVRSDDRYPNQARPNVLSFNREMKAMLEPYHVVVVDFFNLTRNARSTDGQHYVSDVNLYKALVFVDLLRSMS